MAKCPECGGELEARFSDPIRWVEGVDIIKVIPSRWQCKECKKFYEEDPQGNLTETETEED